MTTARTGLSLKPRPIGAAMVSVFEAIVYCVCTDKVGITLPLLIKFGDHTSFAY